MRRDALFKLSQEQEHKLSKENCVFEEARDREIR
jgi:hypothetical protein